MNTFTIHCGSPSRERQNESRIASISRLYVDGNYVLLRAGEFTSFHWRRLSSNTWLTLPSCWMKPPYVINPTPSERSHGILSLTKYLASPGTWSISENQTIPLVINFLYSHKSWYMCSYVTGSTSQKAERPCCISKQQEVSKILSPPWSMPWWSQKPSIWWWLPVRVAKLSALRFFEARGTIWKCGKAQKKEFGKKTVIPTVWTQDKGNHAILSGPSHEAPGCSLGQSDQTCRVLRLIGVWIELTL